MTWNENIGLRPASQGSQHDGMEKLKKTEREIPFWFHQKRDVQTKNGQKSVFGKPWENG
jgi:hypothetical protein